MSKLFKVLQLTDTHLVANPDTEVRGFNTAACLQRVINHILSHHRDADAVLLTGDLSQDGSEQSYYSLQQEIARLGKPSFAIPGNHDRLSVMQATLDPGIIQLQKSFKLGNWQWLLLDSTVDGQVAGTLSDDELHWLQSRLQENTDIPTLLALHHHPVPTGGPWMDRINLKNCHALLAALEKAPQVRLIVYGHIHQVAFSQFNGIDIHGTPSTWRQFKPLTGEFALDVLPPAYRIFYLAADGGYRTHVEFVNRS